MTPFPGILMLDNTNNVAADQLLGGLVITMTFDPFPNVTAAGILAAYNHYHPLSGGVSGVLAINPQGVIGNGVLHVTTP